MDQNSKIDLRAYLRRRGASRLMADAFAIGATAVAGVALQHASGFFRSAPMFAFLLKDPFTLLSAAIFFLSFYRFRFYGFQTTPSWLGPLLRKPSQQAN
jgi:hypothetical protein